MEVHTLGTYTHTSSLQVEGAWVCPWMSMSLVSMTQLMKAGYTFTDWNRKGLSCEVPRDCMEGAVVLCG